MVLGGGWVGGRVVLGGGGWVGGHAGMLACGGGAGMHVYYTWS